MVEVSKVQVKYFGNFPIIGVITKWVLAIYRSRIYVWLLRIMGVFFLGLALMFILVLLQL
ncbi:MAG: hypothetical protein A3C30_03710 [Candidatus Levybacteria bacterium RIFCSPHIGHO2_02_FULL_40_18]|nr:MAG: hypothetical protein A2869_00285 [Candidatus Levybacteria bacterium RIFCSPHIGHO2_01_FULL_40_58]OGH26192.1 MAG: hypothetical protein A3C30_03710 [Candidatus Levybacteria bacterium RIFCSPHIGHO2_02_FULL_40_18]OGH31354.1 MAG: hypothetical protein A3E43_03210 [Candidatus Levybacteria bacterium RIFCSPHIGHO2_12_FULL_40_31]OGH40075.1 MAG: hypothetical protein A2894_04025 [Candidatus Levybacteria bacterium RIFCSPLOWO2_01_FULL_40_64]OGH49038.1 MAG: hypothetical protein A3I54_00490 [Candidatus Lev